MCRDSGCWGAGRGRTAEEAQKLFPTSGRAKKIHKPDR